MRQGEVLTVTAAAGGTGHVATQLGLLAGCHVVAVVGSPAKAAALHRLRTHSGRLTTIDLSTTQVYMYTFMPPLICIYNARNCCLCVFKCCMRSLLL
jgi:hypothetical protein